MFKILNLIFLTVRVLNFRVIGRLQRCFLTKKPCLFSLKVQAHVCTFYFSSIGERNIMVLLN
jgi:hypothetical protein